jgi:hypothetical protein
MALRTQATNTIEEIMTDLQFRAIIKMVYERFVAEIHSGKDPEQLEKALKEWVENVAGIEPDDSQRR